MPGLGFRREVLEKILDDDSDMHQMNLTARAMDLLERQARAERDLQWWVKGLVLSGRLEALLHMSLSSSAGGPGGCNRVWASGRCIAVSSLPAGTPHMVRALREETYACRMPFTVAVLASN